MEFGARTLPPPAPVDTSKVVRDALSKTMTPNVAAMKAIKLTSDEEWEAFAATANAKGAKGACKFAEMFNVKVVEDTIAGVNVHWVTPPEIDKNHQQYLFLFIHGGAWFLNAGLSGTTEAVLIAARMKISVNSIDYRMPPKYPAPAAIDDASAVWKELLKKTPPASVIMGGTSAGGNITLSSVHRFKDLGLPLPGALYIGTPAVDVDLTGDSRFINEGVDRLLITWKPLPQEAGAMYAGELGKTHPYVSPIYGDFTGFPPSCIIAGTRDLMLSDAVRARRSLRRAGAEADLHNYEGFSHGDYLVIWNAPESEEHCTELNRFVLNNLSNPLPLQSDIHEGSEKFEIPKSTIYRDVGHS